jgi:hypothetical protein
MQNPFAVPGRSEADIRPLCPWQHGDHEHLYAPVDHTEAAFDAFRAAVAADPGLVGDGRMVLVTGHEGCGKSALMHRAAWWTKAHLAASGTAVHIVDLMAEHGGGESGEIRVEHVLRRMLDEARQLTVLTAEELAGLAEREDKLRLVLPFLSSALARHSVGLLVLLPPAEVAADLHRYAAHARGGILYFVESSYLAGPEPGFTVCGKPVVHLQVGLLSEDDGWAFVHSRIDRAAAAGMVTPAIAEATISRFMRDRITGRGRTTIRELQRTCESVFSAAISAQSAQVEYGDFTQYYVQKATL